MIKFARSFVFALEGLGDALVFERNFRILWLISIFSALRIFLLISGAFYRVIFILLILMVLAFELLNSAIEKSCDCLGTQILPFVKKAKDFSAGAVLLMAITWFKNSFFILTETRMYEIFRLY